MTESVSKPIRSYRDLVVWQKAFAIGLSAYRITSDFPKDERFGLVMQMRRAAVSVASNIAEGYGRGGRADYSRFLKMARGSLYELETQTALAAELAYLATEAATRFAAQLLECERTLAGLIRAIDKPREVSDT